MLVLYADMIRGIKDPEHEESLEDLKVVYRHGVDVDAFQRAGNAMDSVPHKLASDARYLVHVEFTPTVPHCSLATLIGLCIRMKLEDSYPGKFLTQSINQSIDHVISLPLFIQSINQAINRTVHPHSQDQSINQSIEHVISLLLFNQPINQSIADNIAVSPVHSFLWFFSHFFRTAQAQHINKRRHS